MKFLLVVLVIACFGGAWGVLMSFLLPQPYSMIASIAGGFVIGYFGMGIAFR